MKTIEEKAEAYDFAIEKAKELMKKGYDVLMPELFPELAISEDERIRKFLLNLVTPIIPEIIEQEGVDKDAVLNYLERQKEQKLTTIPERICPKFSVGDTVRRKGYADHAVIEIYLCKDPVYICKNDEGLESHIPFSEQDKWELVKEQKPNPLYGTTNEYYHEAYYADSKKPENYDHEMWKNCEANFEGGKQEVINNPEKYGLQKIQKIEPSRPSWKPTKDQLESIRYLLEEYRPWLINSADARKDLRDVYEQLKKL